MEEQGAVTVMGAPDGASKAFRALIVFARLPVPGKVKSRLARGVGMGAACEFYKACAEKIIAEAARCPDVVRYLFFADVEDAPEIARWMHAIGQAASLQIRAQAEGDVGARMRAAFGSVFADGASQAVVVGTDIPDLSAAVLMSSFHALDHHDVVFGPAQDGGYYLLGLTRPLPALFEGIAWSTSDVLARSRQAACDAGLSVAPSESLPTLLDVDTADDLEHWYADVSISMQRTISRSRSLSRRPVAPPGTGGAAVTEGPGPRQGQGQGQGLLQVAGLGEGGLMGKLEAVGDAPLGSGDVPLGAGELPLGGRVECAAVQKGRELARTARDVIEEKHQLEEAMAETGFVL